MELFDWYAHNPEEAGYFNAAMGNLSALAASELVRVYDVSTVQTVVDVGGAHGVLLAAVLHANPNAHGILFELPHVIATADDAIAAKSCRAIWFRSSGVAPVHAVLRSARSAARRLPTASEAGSSSGGMAARASATSARWRRYSASSRSPSR